MNQQDTPYTAYLPESTDKHHRASIDSASSAADRRRWRNHAHVLTPEPQAVERDPFDQFAVNLWGTAVHQSSGENTENGSEEENDRLEEEVKYFNEGQGPRHSMRSGGSRAHAGEDRTGTGTGTEKKRVQNDDREDNRDERRHSKLPWRERIRHFTWTWFCLTMATGGIANVLYAVPFHFSGLYTLGCIFFIGNMVLFIFNIFMISCRFYFYPRTFRASFLHPTESLFIPAAIVSFGIIMMNISQYGVGMMGEKRWLQHVMIVLFWVDCGLAVTFSLGIYLIMFVPSPPILLDPHTNVTGGQQQHLQSTK